MQNTTKKQNICKEHSESTYRQASLSITLLCRNGKNSFQKFLHPDPDPDNFQNSTLSYLSKLSSLIKFS